LQFTRRFGLVRVDFKTQKRTIKDTGHWYARVTATDRMAV
jgi:beta-glucosidase